MEFLLYSFIWWQILSITVVSSGYHRYFSHKSFKANVWYEYYVLLLGTLTGGGPLLGWVGVHRLHHKHSDTEKDPHSPKYLGIFRVMFSHFKVERIERKYVKDLLSNKRVMWFFRNHYRIRVMTAILSILVAFLISWQLAVVIFVSPMLYSYLGFGMINAFAHGANGPRNSHLINVLAGGDGFHKNHHDNPRDWQIGKKWYEFDPGALFIQLIKID